MFNLKRKEKKTEETRKLLKNLARNTCCEKHRANRIPKENDGPNLVPRGLILSNSPEV